MYAHALSVARTHTRVCSPLGGTNPNPNPNSNPNPNPNPNPNQAGVYLAGGVVGLASCVWPYARLGLLLLCLWSPPARLPPRRCLLLLRVCDGLGKFALVDFVMLNLLTVVLRIDASLPRAATRAAPAAAAPAITAPFLAITARVSEMSWYL